MGCSHSVRMGRTHSGWKWHSALRSAWRAFLYAVWLVGHVQIIPQPYESYSVIAEPTGFTGRGVGVQFTFRTSLAPRR